MRLVYFKKINKHLRAIIFSYLDHVSHLRAIYLNSLFRDGTKFNQNFLKMLIGFKYLLTDKSKVINSIPVFKLVQQKVVDVDIEDVVNCFAFFVQHYSSKHSFYKLKVHVEELHLFYMVAQQLDNSKFVYYLAPGVDTSEENKIQLQILLSSIKYVDASLMESSFFRFLKDEGIELNIKNLFYNNDGAINDYFRLFPNHLQELSFHPQYDTNALLELVKLNRSSLRNFPIGTMYDQDKPLFIKECESISCIDSFSEFPDTRKLFCKSYEEYIPSMLKLTRLSIDDPTTSQLVLIGNFMKYTVHLEYFRLDIESLTGAEINSLMWKIQSCHFKELSLSFKGEYDQGFYDKLHSNIAKFKRLTTYNEFRQGTTEHFEISQVFSINCNKASELPMLLIAHLLERTRRQVNYIKCSDSSLLGEVVDFIAYEPDLTKSFRNITFTDELKENKIVNLECIDHLELQRVTDLIVMSNARNVTSLSLRTCDDEKEELFDFITRVRVRNLTLPLNEITLKLLEKLSKFNGSSFLTSLRLVAKSDSSDLIDKTALIARDLARFKFLCSVVVDRKNGESIYYDFKLNRFIT